MAPKTFGRIGPLSTSGETSVFQKLRKYLPANSVVFYEPRVNSPRLTRKPDFVIVHPAWGVTVLEVKDWRAHDLDGINASQVRLCSGKTATSPVEQARVASEALHELLEQNVELLQYSNLHSGRLSFPYRHAGVVPYIGGNPLQRIKTYWGESHVLGADELDDGARLLAYLEAIEPRFGYMTQRHVDVVCNLLDPTRFESIRETGTEKIRGFYDAEQVDIATADLERLANKQNSAPEIENLQLPGWSDIMTDEARDTALYGSHIRLVRGFAGTGKTDVMLLRARYLHQQYPDLKILVTTFNKPLFEQRLKPELKNCDKHVTTRRFMQLCNEIYADYLKQQGHKRDFNSIRNVSATVWKLVKQDKVDLGRFNADFVADEITWMKDIGRTKREDYVNMVREGRGSGADGMRMSRGMKEQMFDIFEMYQAKLSELGVIDWADLPVYALQHLSNGGTPSQQYDVILIDEAQHFAPTWVGVIRHFLKPEGTLFLCEDPSQSVYRFFSWSQRGLNVRGKRTRWLRTPYRNTRQIFQAAYALIETNEVALQLLSESGEQVIPDLEHEAIRDGELPEVRNFWQWRDERTFIEQKIDQLIESGVPAHEIGILHRDKYVLKRYRDTVGRKGVQIFETRQQTGLEYTMVFVPQVDAMFPEQSDELSEDEMLRNQLEFYMTMTRARDKLYLSYNAHWPQFLDPIKPFVQAIDGSISI